jgi:magnesium-transporting ATPase (P-type)
MSTIYRDIDSVYIYTKGAPEFVIKNCTKFLNKNGVPQKIDKNFINNLNSTILKFNQ